MADFYANYTHPHVNINVKDESVGAVVNNVILPLHKPFFPIRAAKGDVNVPHWFTGAEALAHYGKETFEKTSKFYRNEQLYIQNGITENQAAWYCRLATDDAKKSSLVIEAQVVTADIPQYKRDASGAIVYEIDPVTEEEIPVTLKDELNNPVTESGVKVIYTARPLEDGEVFDMVETKAVADGTKYPIMAFEYLSPGVAGDDSCFKFFCEPASQTEAGLAQHDALLYTFMPMEKAYGSDTPANLSNIFGTSYTQFYLKPDVVEKSTGRQLSSNETVLRYYTNTISKQYTLPYNVHFYSENVEAVAQAILDSETNAAILEEVSNPWMVNICTLTTLDNIPFTHAILGDENEVKFNSVWVNYLAGGTDGDISDKTFEELYRNVLKMKSIPELIDTAKYPITHLYDVGYTYDTKEAMAIFMGTQKRCKVELAAHETYNFIKEASEEGEVSYKQVTMPMQDMDSSISMATAVRSACLLTPESELYGTPACRGEIFGQSGYLNDTNVKAIVPATLWIMQKRAQYHNTTFIKNTVKGSPNNNVTIFRKWNWTPFAKDQRQLNWDNGINYFQYADMQTLFYPDIRTIYTEETSMLSETTYTDAIVYLMYMIDKTWAEHSGRTIPSNQLYDLVTKAIEGKAYAAFGNLFTVTATMYQTEAEALAGFIHHIQVVMTGYSPTRVWEADIIVRRENLDSAASE